jgi:hypothetical protein
MRDGLQFHQRDQAMHLGLRAVPGSASMRAQAQGLVAQRRAHPVAAAVAV